ncbi:hypothetical protein C1T31_12035 [Hanstruepera neustonica]|uniref:Uncharacterized protein n=1 Tax=Hanstruepera neustonica TaxID=1445657 RepID=A0A2K1DWY1_9FLAO|nr:hypothetical protein C1T31_12035 [Hanstruepera neustonica]
MASRLYGFLPITHVNSKRSLRLRKDLFLISVIAREALPKQSLIPPNDYEIASHFVPRGRNDVLLLLPTKKNKNASVIAREARPKQSVGSTYRL